MGELKSISQSAIPGAGVEKAAYGIDPAAAE
jgi:hypothetical protein